jgi:pimeloyl-ACP methyl ester carboxylesterase
MNTREVSTSVDSRSLYGWLTGEGEPTVVLEAGLGGTAQDWEKVRLQVAKFAAVFSYDRAGLGRSDPAPTPRTCQDIIADLRALLRAAHLRPPFVLVAHSWSGLNARWFANCHPGEVAGLLLIDAVHEDKYTRFEAVLPAERAERMWASVRNPDTNDEHIDRMESIRQVRETQRDYDFPLIILTRATDADEMNAIETGLQAEFLGLSKESRQSIAKSDDHFIQNAEPQLVIDAIRELVERARQGS